MQLGSCLFSFLHSLLEAEITDQAARKTAPGEWKVKQEQVLKVYVDEQAQRAAAGLPQDVRGPVYDKMAEHFFSPPTYTTVDDKRVVSVVPGMDHSKWVSLEKVVFGAISAPIRHANDMKEADTATKKAAAREKREDRARKVKPKLGDVTGSYSGLYLGGAFPEDVQHVEQVARQDSAEAAHEREERQHRAEGETRADLIEGRRWVESEVSKDKPTMVHKKAILIAYRQFKGGDEEALKALKENTGKAADCEVVFTAALEEIKRAGGAGFLWSEMGVMPLTVAEVAGGGPLAAGQLDAAVVVVSGSRDRKQRWC